VISGGKARETDFVYDRDEAIVRDRTREVRLSPGQRGILETLRPGGAAEMVTARREALRGLRFLTPADMAEMVIAANHTGLMPDIPTLHAAALHTTEVAEVYSTGDEGGILGREGCIEIFACLRTEQEPGQMGGEFMVVAIDNDYNREFLKRKHLIMNRTGTAGLIYRPLHLLGMETPISVLCAAMGMSTGGAEVRPLVDEVVRTRVAMPAGTVLEQASLYDHELFEPLMVPAFALSSASPVPLYMAAGGRLTKDVPAGTTLTADHVAMPPNEELSRLRTLQEKEFRL
jgi:predicted homoserine dehydrogenase-like protein